MNTFPIAAIVVRNAAERAINSARPNAPVVPEPERRIRESRFSITRRVIAGALHRAGDVVAPPACSSVA
jgi:hypothetical protein